MIVWSLIICSSQPHLDWCFIFLFCIPAQPWQDSQIVEYNPKDCGQFLQESCSLFGCPDIQTSSCADSHWPTLDGSLCRSSVSKWLLLQLQCLCTALVLPSPMKLPWSAERFTWYHPSPGSVLLQSVSTACSVLCRHTPGNPAVNADADLGTRDQLHIAY